MFYYAARIYIMCGVFNSNQAVRQLIYQIVTLLIRKLIW